MKYYNGASWIELADKDHTHTTSIASSSETSGVVNLAFGSKYAITAGGTTAVFKMPSSPSTVIYKHSIEISETGHNYKFCFTVYSPQNSALTFKQAITLLFGSISAWAKTTVPLTIVKNEWNQAVFLSRSTLSSVGYTGSGQLNRKYTLEISPTEGGIEYNQVQGLLTISSSTYEIAENNATVTDTVSTASPALL